MSKETEKRVVCIICQEPVLLAERWWTKCNCKLEIHRKCIAEWQMELDFDVCVPCPSCKTPWHNPLYFARNNGISPLEELMHYQAVRSALAQDGYLEDPEHPPSTSEGIQVDRGLLHMRMEIASINFSTSSHKWPQECEVLIPYIRVTFEWLSSESNTQDELHEPQLPETDIYARHLARARSIISRLEYLIHTTRTLEFLLQSVMSLDEDLSLVLIWSAAAIRVMEVAPQLFQQVKDIWDDLNGPLKNARNEAETNYNRIKPRRPALDESALDYLESLARGSTGSGSPLSSPPIPQSLLYLSEEQLEAEIKLSRARQKMSIGYRNASVSGAQFMNRITEFDRLVGDIIGRVQGCNAFLAGLDIASLWPDEN